MKPQVRTRTRILTALAVIATIWGCVSGGGISGTFFVLGPISDFGSVIVNGIEFDTTDALISLEGDPVEESDLRLGMVIVVRGRVNRARTNGVAEIVSSNHLLLGPVEAVNTADGTFVALSQLVITGAETIFDQVTLGTLEPGDNVEVFGFIDGDGSIRATRVERFVDIEEIELTGTISDLDAAAETFMIGLLTVDYSGALLEDLPPTGLANGLLVEVESDEAPVDDLFVALGVEGHNPFELVEPDDGIEVSGVISEVVSTSEFVLNASQHVFVTPETVFEGGDAGDLILNARIEVEGMLDGTGTLVADEIEFLGGGG